MCLWLLQRFYLILFSVWVIVLESILGFCLRPFFFFFKFFVSTVTNSKNYLQIDDKYKKKIEGIIRKAPRGDQLVDEVRLEMTPCPYCDKPLSSIELVCTSCQSTLPFCIATVSVLRVSIIDSFKTCNSNSTLIFLLLFSIRDGI